MSKKYYISKYSSNELCFGKFKPNKKAIDFNGEHRQYTLNFIHKEYKSCIVPEIRRKSSVGSTAIIISKKGLLKYLKLIGFDYNSLDI